MKEAAGEANMTVITIVLIAIVLGVGTIVVNRLMSGTSKKSCCTNIGGKVTGNYCIVGNTQHDMTQQWMDTYCKNDGVK